MQQGFDAGRLGGCLGLSAAMAFFALKLWNVELLRFDTSVKSLALIAVGVVLLHGDAIRRRLDCAVLPGNAAIAATTLLGLGLKRVQGAVDSGVTRGSEKFRRRILALLPGELAGMWTFAPHGWILAACLCIPRAPPA
ncbi:MAG: hypothetical protein KKI02_00820 [Planctomycetes bacterium]|nr:hypothetical protein [Planctomycetota bacterium]